ncbi:RNA polymerase sigma-70 factor, ECF subfamily [bacterium A37T11]|nr:RNA polymerase sigma-70 factor, ECF subfamily [bacterium A37T11]
MPNMQSLSDKVIFENFKDNFERALQELYRRYYSKLLAVALNRLENQEDAEECVQDVMFNLFKQRYTLVLQTESLSYYLVKAVMNRSLRMMAQHHRRRTYSTDYSPELHTDITPERQIIFREFHEQIENSINDLPSQCQLVFRMNKDYGLSAKEISMKLAISENTVNSHLKKAKKLIRKNLDITLPILLHLLYFMCH